MDTQVGFHGRTGWQDPRYPDWVRLPATFAQPVSSPATDFFEVIVMDAGVIALIAGLVAVGLIAIVPMAWKKAAGGLLIVLTVVFIVTDVARLLAR